MGAVSRANAPENSSILLNTQQQKQSLETLRQRGSSALNDVRFRQLQAQGITVIPEQSLRVLSARSGSRASQRLFSISASKPNADMSLREESPEYIDALTKYNATKLLNERFGTNYALPSLLQKTKVAPRTAGKYGGKLSVSEAKGGDKYYERKRVISLLTPSGSVLARNEQGDIIGSKGVVSGKITPSRKERAQRLQQALADGLLNQPDISGRTRGINRQSSRAEIRRDLVLNRAIQRVTGEKVGEAPFIRSRDIPAFGVEERLGRIAPVETPFSETLNQRQRREFIVSAIESARKRKGKDLTNREIQKAINDAGKKLRLPKPGPRFRAGAGQDVYVSPEQQRRFERAVKRPTPKGMRAIVNVSKRTIEYVPIAQGQATGGRQQMKTVYNARTGKTTKEPMEEYVTVSTASAKPGANIADPFGIKEGISYDPMTLEVKETKVPKAIQETELPFLEDMVAGINPFVSPEELKEYQAQRKKVIKRVSPEKKRKKEQEYNEILKQYDQDVSTYNFEAKQAEELANFLSGEGKALDKEIKKYYARFIVDKRGLRDPAFTPSFAPLSEEENTRLFSNIKGRADRFNYQLGEYDKRFGALPSKGLLLDTTAKDLETRRKKLRYMVPRATVGEGANKAIESTIFYSPFGVASSLYGPPGGFLNVIGQRAGLEENLVKRSLGKTPMVKAQLNLETQLALIALGPAGYTLRSELNRSLPMVEEFPEEASARKALVFEALGVGALAVTEAGARATVARAKTLYRQMEPVDIKIKLTSEAGPAGERINPIYEISGRSRWTGKRVDLTKMDDIYATFSRDLKKSELTTEDLLRIERIGEAKVKRPLSEFNKIGASGERRPFISLYDDFLGYELKIPKLQEADIQAFYNPPDLPGVSFTTERGKLKASIKTAIPETAKAPRIDETKAMRTFFLGNEGEVKAGSLVVRDFYRRKAIEAYKYGRAKFIPERLRFKGIVGDAPGPADSAFYLGAMDLEKSFYSSIPRAGENPLFKQIRRDGIKANETVSAVDDLMGSGLFDDYAQYNKRMALRALDFSDSKMALDKTIEKGAEKMMPQKIPELIDKDKRWRIADPQGIFQRKGGWFSEGFTGRKPSKTADQAGGFLFDGEIKGDRVKLVGEEAVVGGRKVKVTVVSETEGRTPINEFFNLKVPDAIDYDLVAREGIRVQGKPGRPFEKVDAGDLFGNAKPKNPKPTGKPPKSKTPYGQRDFGPGRYTGRDNLGKQTFGPQRGKTLPEQEVLETIYKTDIKQASRQAQVAEASEALRAGYLSIPKPLVTKYKPSISETRVFASLRAREKALVRTDTLPLTRVKPKTRPEFNARFDLKQRIAFRPDTMEKVRVDKRTLFEPRPSQAVRPKSLSKLRIAEQTRTATRPALETRPIEGFSFGRPSTAKPLPPPAVGGFLLPGPNVAIRGGAPFDFKFPDQPRQKKKKRDSKAVTDAIARTLGGGPVFLESASAKRAYARQVKAFGLGLAPGLPTPGQAKVLGLKGADKLFKPAKSKKKKNRRLF